MSFGEQVGYYGFTKLEFKENEDEFDIKNNCFSIEIDEDVQWNENNAENQNLKAFQKGRRN